MKNLSLSGLDVPFTEEMMDERMRAYDKKKAEYKRDYGDEWYEHWARDRDIVHNYDVQMKSINEGIYHGYPMQMMGCPKTVQMFYEKQDARLRELYGERYEELKYHNDKDAFVAELLVVDAVKTGKWEELPDELQSEYRKRVCDIR